MNRLILVAGLLFFVSVVHAQGKKIFEKVTLRQSFQSTSEKAEPAFITYTNPKNSQASWAVNAAIGYKFEPTTKALTIDPYFEFHRNTIIDKEQYNWQTGISAEWMTQDLHTKGWSPVLIGAEKYNKDKIKEVSSMQGNLYFTPLFKNKGGALKYFWLPHATTNLGSLLHFYYAPYIGLEHENRIQTPDKTYKGNIYRVLLRVNPTLFFHTKNDDVLDRVALTMDYQYRNDFSKSVDDLSSDDHRFFTASLLYTFFKTADDKSAKIGFDYVNGENPSKGFQKQSFYAVTLKIKL